MNTQYLKIYEFNEINSTNDFLLQNSDKPPVLCISSKQTHGKGQHGRTWENQKKSALFSLKIILPSNTSLNGLSLVVGLCVIRALSNNYNIKDLYIKWPNDIYQGDKKLAGILIENIIKSDVCSCVIGIGINMVASANVASINLNISPKTLILEITQNILEQSAVFISNGFTKFMHEWQKYDYLIHCQKIIHYNGNTYRSQGINDEGHLILINAKDRQIISSSAHMRVE